MQVCITPHHSFFTGQKPLLPPNQQCRRTEGQANEISICIITVPRPLVAKITVLQIKLHMIREIPHKDIFSLEHTCTFYLVSVPYTSGKTLSGTLVANHNKT